MLCSWVLYFASGACCFRFDCNVLISSRCSTQQSAAKDSGLRVCKGARDEGGVDLEAIRRCCEVRDLCIQDDVSCFFNYSRNQTKQVPSTNEQLLKMLDN